MYRLQVLAVYAIGGTNTKHIMHRGTIGAFVPDLRRVFDLFSDIR